MSEAKDNKDEKSKGKKKTLSLNKTLDKVVDAGSVPMAKKPTWKADDDAFKKKK